MNSQGMATLQSKTALRPFTGSKVPSRPSRYARMVTCRAHLGKEGYVPLLHRREALAAAFLAGLSQCLPAGAFTPPPAGFRLHQDKLDGYSFVYPEDWSLVTTSGNDVFLRNPYNIEEILFVDLSSPSSSKYQSVQDLGSPEDAAKRALDQYLNKEFMSTRIGIRREAEIVGASTRTADDGRMYYDLQVRMASYASRNPYVATRAEVMKDYGLEWDRQLITTLGVANQRLYELRLQTSSTGYEQDKDKFRRVLESFRVKEVEK
eukprot:jgi/Chrzof1/8507/Cz03g13190.t1_PPD1[v5.2]